MKKKFDEVKAKLLEINDVIRQVDQSLRVPALQVLLPVYFPEASEWRTANSHESDHGAADALGVDNFNDFMAPFKELKPAKNVILIVAWLYSRCGSDTFFLSQIQELGKLFDVPLPNRPDNTMRQAQSEDKKLFVQHGKGWRLSETGESYIVSRFKIEKGKRSSARSWVYPLALPRLPNLAGSA